MSQEQAVREALSLFSQKVTENREYLSELDTPIGDGDHGGNMKRGMDALQEKLDDQAEDASVVDLLKAAAMAMMSKVGGASGPLYGTAFLEIAKALQGQAGDWGAAIQAAADGIAKRGHAQAGDKTMLDVWLPAAEALKEGSLTAEQIDGWVQATEDMQARKGRASYVGERSVGHIDPGAMSTSYWLKALVEAGVLND
ncbi:dihydroxyacetone kinase subunit DhaL [Aerococcus sanguinicola]|uniref:dihydroxyacetone kinase subunit DhaL n=1 Tax=unclassified Aerococcus TaxID=2618060 RepID=UPI0008A33985|nr:MULTISPECIES: dihydroxyacetone kinase subunit DhaL [unclassified Aerococcus]KAB0647708.1 dihydroxyacetone kinase subunit L [Aerococcus sanguinicola]MDK6233051.1 dihydroxyacetone kinase subunit DhaL [Aerococcus sp. UMB10185]MDK6855346.1 dihydroxyacetone kinase subunit DhaL [Aerococcus sp. UMB7533]OFN05057.1 dihydroxyacetone kinase subunit L [Aerococcus sp. HMSC062A02]OHO43784.1 dihydroxyacetone kinase subunit L [Aerococcus sp. HMSC035B07]